MKRLGFVVLAVFSILVVIGMVLDEDVRNASFREVMRGVGIAFAVIFSAYCGLYSGILKRLNGGGWTLGSVTPS